MQRLILYVALLASSTFGAYTNATLNISACGGRLSDGSYTNIGSLVPVGGQTSQCGSLYHYSGFAAGFILQPTTAFSGLPDELNPDNDLDGLDDDEEIAAGSSLYNSDTDNDGLSDFDEVHTYGTNPARADSDGDSMGDAQELIAGTSATNRSSVLAVNCTPLSDGRRQVSWFGVSGRAYTLQYTDSLGGDWQSYPFEIPGNGSIVSFTDAEIRSNRFYRVNVRGLE